MQAPWIKRIRRSSSVKAWCAAACLVTFVAPPLAAQVYTFTDGAGVQHFSNVPSDPRYRPADEEAGTFALRPPPMAPIASVVVGIDRLIRDTAAEQGLPTHLLHAVVRAESNYRPDAVSAKGAVGLMQLMPATARRYGVNDARDPAANVRAGSRYLKDLLLRYDGDLPLALAAYNAGPEAVARHGNRIPPYAETQRYVARVLAGFPGRRLAEDKRPPTLGD